MTYLEFHLVFLLPPLALLGWRALRRSRDRALSSLAPVAGLAGIALLYTTPWDNYLVYREVWSYGADRVIGTLGFVPIEEYLFFMLQPFLLGLLYLEFEPHDLLTGRPDRKARWLGSLFWILAALAGAFLLRSERGTYLGLILIWAAPVLAAMWAWAGHRFIDRRRPALLTVLPVSAYLWIADRFAIGLGIWDISPELTTGVAPLGLPIEEAVFFLLTNVLVVQGLILFRDPPTRAERQGNALA